MRLPNGLLLAASLLSLPALADTQFQTTSGAHYSDGKYGDEVSTSALVVPFSMRLSSGSWSVRASVPYLFVDGTDDVSEIIDDSGGSSGSGSSSSGSGSSGSGSGGDDDDEAEEEPRGDDLRTSGIGDAAVSVTWSVDSIADSPVYLDLTGRVRLPTGDEEEGLGVGATDYHALAEFGWDGEAAGVFVSGGRRFLGSTEGADRVDGWQASAGGWLNLDGSVVLGAYYDWRNASVRDGEDPSSVEAYVTWRVSPAWKIELHGGAGLSDASADYSAGVTLIWRTTPK